MTRHLRPKNDTAFASVTRQERIMVRSAHDIEWDIATRVRRTRPRGPRRSPTWHRALVVVLLLLWSAVAQAQTETVEYYGYDAIGSIRVVFNAAGAVIGRGDYLPFGEEGATSFGLPSERFTGQARDAEAGFDYFNARNVQPRHGRFTRPDPVFARLFDPQAWNRYVYTANNPVSFVDPTGLWIICTTDPEGTVCSGGPNPGGPGGGGGGGGGGGACPSLAPMPGGGCESGGGGGVGDGPPSTGPGEPDPGEGEQIYAPLPPEGVPLCPQCDVISPIAVPVAAIQAARASPRVVSALFRWLTGKSSINPFLVRFSQDSIKSTFSDGSDVWQAIERLRRGTLAADAFPPIQLAERDGLLFTLDNRRLFMFRGAGVDAPFRFANEAEVAQAIAQDKFSTINNGFSIVVRGVPK